MEITRRNVPHWPGLSVTYCVQLLPVSDVGKLQLSGPGRGCREGLSRWLTVYSVTSGRITVTPSRAGSRSHQSPETGPLVSSLAISLHAPRLLAFVLSLTAIASSVSLIPLPSSSVSVPRLRFLYQHSDSSSAGFKPLRPFRNLGNNCNAEEEKGRESLCRKSVLNSQLHRVQQQRQAAVLSDSSLG